MATPRHLHYTVLRLGKKHPLQQRTALALPQTPCPCSLRRLLSDVVAAQVAAYDTRQAASASPLTTTMLEHRARGGKVSMGEQGNETPVDLARAQAAALQAFEDGLYAVFADEEQLLTLQQSVHWRTVHAFKFLRLTFLSGRRW